LPEGAASFHCGDIGPETDWSEVLQGITHVIHLAGRVHRMVDPAADPEREYHRVNVLGTERLARSAAAAGVRRFLFLSTAKVHGEGREDSYREDNPPQPSDPYSRSKWEAEEILRGISKETGMETVILRPPLIYGPGVKANFLRLLQLTEKRPPLPLGGVSNRRSLLYLGNLIDAIMVCLLHPNAAGETFLIRDCEDLSTPELIDRLSLAMGKTSRLFPFPVSLLRGLGRVACKSRELDRLTGSFCLDDRKIRSVLNWNPPFSPEQGLRETVKWYLQGRNGRTADHF